MAAEETAFDALCRAVPTTIAGARAGIEYLMAIEYSRHVSVLHTYLAEALLPTTLLQDRGPVDDRCLIGSRLNKLVAQRLLGSVELNAGKCLAPRAQSGPWRSGSTKSSGPPRPAEHNRRHHGHTLDDRRNRCLE
jgi:hypothetical protein